MNLREDELPGASGFNKQKEEGGVPFIILAEVQVSSVFQVHQHPGSAEQCANRAERQLNEEDVNDLHVGGFLDLGHLELGTSGVLHDFRIVPCIDN